MISNQKTGNKSMSGCPMPRIDDTKFPLLHFWQSLDPLITLPELILRGSFSVSSMSGEKFVQLFS